jgi:hypothetical protein
MTMDIASFSGLPCPKCGHVIEAPGSTEFDGYFRKASRQCPFCNENIPLWSSLLGAMRAENSLMPGAVALGAARSTFGTITLRRDVPTTLDLSQLDVPPDSTVLSIHFTVVGGASPGFLTPALMSQSVTRDSIPHVLSIFPARVDGGADENVMNVLCTWFDSAGVDLEAEALLSAIESYSEGKYRQAIVPASVAVEDKLNSVLRSHFGQFAGKDKVSSFLSDGATFGYQLNPLLPSLMSFVDAPAMPTELTDGLSKLRKLRNKVAHEHHVVTRNEASESVLAAVFGYRYLELYGQLLSPSPPASNG